MGENNNNFQLQDPSSSSPTVNLFLDIGADVLYDPTIGADQLINSTSSNNSMDNQDFVNNSYYGNATSGVLEVPPHFLVMSTDSRNCVIAYCLIFIISATGNFSVFFTVLKQLRRTKSRISTLMLHLSIADLLVTFGIIPLEVIWRITVQWFGGNVLCKICKFFSAFGLYLSSMVLICISLDRYFAIMHPLRVSDARRRGKLMLISAWVTATICSAPQVLIFHVDHHPDYPTFIQCVAWGFFSPAEELVYNILSVSFMYFVPLIVVIFTYVAILCKISRKSRQQRETRKNSSEVGNNSSASGGSSSGRILLRRTDTKQMERAKSRTLKLTVVIVLAFILCWSPYVTMTMWYMIDRSSAQMVDPRIQDALFIMAVANSCLNPLVYGSYTRECRDSLMSLCGIFRSCRRNRSNNGEYENYSMDHHSRNYSTRKNAQMKIRYTASQRSTRTASFRASPSPSPGNNPTRQTFFPPSRTNSVGRRGQSVRFKTPNLLEIEGGGGSGGGGRGPMEIPLVVLDIEQNSTNTQSQPSSTSPKGILINIPINSLDVPTGVQETKLVNADEYKFG